MTESQARSTGINMRPQGQPDAPGYSPQRDLAYVYPELMRVAFAMLDECNWTQDIRIRAELAGITEDDLAVGVERFVKALDRFIREPEIKSPVDAFRETEFDATDRLVQQLMFETFGQVLTGGWFQAVRDVTLRGKMSDAAQQTAAMVAAGQLVAASLYSSSSGEDETPRLNYGRYDCYRGTVEAISLRDAANKALQQSQEELKASRNTNYALSEGYRELHLKYLDVCQKEQATVAETQSWLSASFMSRLLLGAKLFMKIIFKREIFNGVASSTKSKVKSNPEQLPTPE